MSNLINLKTKLARLCEVCEVTQGTYTAETLMGVSINIPAIPGLKYQVNFKSVSFSDSSGVKWRICANLSGLTLQHRSKFGRRNGFHSQHKRAWKTSSGFADLITAIVDHELYERGFDGYTGRSIIEQHALAVGE